MDALLATGAALLLGSVACVRLLLDLLAPHLPKHSSPQVHAGSSPSVSTGRAMRRWLVSLLLGALSAGWLALLSEALVLSLARDSLPLVVLVSALRLLGSALFVSAVTSLAVYWATLHNSITGPPFYSVLRYWVAANAVLFAALLLAVLYACVRRSDQEAHLLLACAYLLSFLGLAYYSALVVRVLPRVPSSSRRIMCRLAPLVSALDSHTLVASNPRTQIAVSCSSCAAGSAYYFYRSFESSEWYPPPPPLPPIPMLTARCQSAWTT